MCEHRFEFIRNTQDIVVCDGCGKKMTQEELLATATRLRELLREIKEMLGYCPYCWATLKDPCADVCKIGKELGDV